MKSHVWRPLYITIAVVVLILVVRVFLVPEDFGSYERGYMYGWHRLGNEQEWKDFKVKYKTREYCKNCHYEKYEEIMQNSHGIINCENCHGPAIDHPQDPPRLEINKSRQQCLRCHARLPVKGSGRAVIRSVENSEHNPGMECVMCHNPHKPGFD